MRRIPPVLLACLLCLRLSGGEPAQDWRAGPAVLVERIERLAAAGEVDAAAAVLQELLKREKIGETGLDDRGRMALAQAYLAAGRRDEALAAVGAIAWADKSPKLASGIVALELAIRWQGLLDREDGDRLVSGAIPPLNTLEAPEGRPEGLWAKRWEDYRALADRLDRGVRMVKAEGGEVKLPAPAPLLALARYGRGGLKRVELARELGPSERWDARTALAASLLHLSECEIDEAAAAAEELWKRLPATPEAQEAYRRLRTWQAQRRLADGWFRLWTFPALDKRLDTLAANYADAERKVAAAMEGVRDLNELRMRTDLAATALEPKPADPAATPEIREPVDADLAAIPGNREFRLALDYEGLRLRPPAVQVAAGVPISLTVASIHRGEHRIRLLRLPGAERWRELCRDPKNELLPAAAAAEATLDFDSWPPDGTPSAKTAEFPGLAEGFYAATATARGCPVVSLVGFMAVEPDLHLLAGRDSVLVWVVRRADGTARKDEPVAIEIELVRNAVAAGGTAYAEADPAWQAGFREGFLDEPEEAFRARSEEELFRGGLEAGKAAAAKDPAAKESRRLVTDGQGLVRLELPEKLRGRSYKAKARIDRPEVLVERSAAHGSDAHWTRKAVAWSDKPFARPGDAVRYKAILRDFNGEALSRPVGEIAARLQLGGETIDERRLAISGTGAVWGEVTLPPGGSGSLTLTLDDGPAHALAVVKSVELPSLRCEFADGGAERTVRSGESVPFRLRVTDAAGEPLPGLSVSCFVSAVAGSVPPPCEQPPAAETDLAGEVEFRIPTLAGLEADYSARFRLEHENSRYVWQRSWRTQTFPFPLEFEVRDRSVEIGEPLRMLCRLPAGAVVKLQLLSESSEGTRGTKSWSELSSPLGEPLEIKGKGEAWIETAIQIGAEHEKANVLRIEAPTLDGGKAERRLPIEIRPAPAPGKGREVELALGRSQVNPGEELKLGLGLTSPGRDLLLAGGTRGLVFSRVERMDAPARSIALPVGEDWAPNLFLEATAYIAGKGFVTTERQEVRVLPVHRLLKVTVRPEREGYRPGDTVRAVVQVADWKDRPAAGVSLSLGVVNELTYELAADTTPDLWKFFHDYRRVWEIGPGDAPPLEQPSALLWRSLLWQWQNDGGGRFGSCFGGRENTVCRGGGGRSTEGIAPILRRGEDPTVFWVADLKTDAKGEATVSFALPADAMQFRCTARANDASAAVLIGEVRSAIASRLPYRCELSAPKFVRPGDKVEATAQLFNYRDEEARLSLTLPDGEKREILLAPQGRARIRLPLETPQPEGPIVRAGLWLGRLFSPAVTLQGDRKDDPELRAATDLLVLRPGLGIERSLRLVAGADGRARLPFAVSPGAAVSLRLRSWPDAAAVRRFALEEWRKSEKGPKAAIAWLLAPAGKERRTRLAQHWPELGTDLASCLARLAAVRRGESAGGFAAVPEGLDGDWLRAHARAAGLNVQAPASRGLRPAELARRAQVCAIALCEGWGEGTTLWTGLRDELLKAEEEPATVDAFGADAAKLAGDKEAFALLIARLGRKEWAEPSVAVLAADLIPEAAAVRPAEVTLLGPAEPVKLKTEAFAEWSGVVKDGLSLASDPGALLHIELLVEQPLPAPDATEKPPRLTWWRLREEGYCPLPAGAPLRPGVAHLLVLDSRESDWSGALTLALPAGFRRLEEAEPVLCIDRWKTIYGLSDERREALSACAARFAPETVAAAAAVPELSARLAPDGERVEVAVADEEDAASGRFGIVMGPRKRLAIPFLPVGEGLCTMEGPMTGDPGFDPRQLPAQLLKIEAGEPDALPLPTPDPGLGRAVAARIEKATEEEISWLSEKAGEWRSEADWRSLLRSLDPEGKATLSELLSHPSCGRRGHWTTAALRTWIDGEPLLSESREQWIEQMGTETPGLAEALLLATLSREERRSARMALPQPQPEPAVRPAPLRRWCERLMDLGLLPKGDATAWLWTQALSGETLAQFGYESTLVGWADFLREELGIELTIEAEVPAWDLVRERVVDEKSGEVQVVSAKKARVVDFLGGDSLGTAGFALNNLVVVQAREGFRLRRLDPRPAIVPPPAPAPETAPTPEEETAVDP